MLTDLLIVLALVLRVLEVSNVIWCTGYAPHYDWIDLSLGTHNGLPIHDRGIVEPHPVRTSWGFPSSTR